MRNHKTPYLSAMAELLNRHRACNDAESIVMNVAEMGNTEKRVFSGIMQYLRMMATDPKEQKGFTMEEGLILLLAVKADVSSFRREIHAVYTKAKPYIFAD